MTLRAALSTLLMIGLLAPAAAAQTTRATPERQRPAAKALRQTLARRPVVRRHVRNLSNEQRQALRAEVRQLVAQSRNTLKTGSHTRRDVLRARAELRRAVRQAIRKSIRGR